MKKVAIVGAGPAGCAAALTLRRYVPELQTVIVSMPAGAEPRVGETLSPGVMPLLEYLGLQADFLLTGQLPAGGTASAWGSERVFERNYVFTGRGTGWHLDRAAFDAWLLARAEAAGALCVRARVVALDTVPEDGRCGLRLQGGEILTADAMIDATGRSAWWARQRGSPPQRDDALLAEIRWYVHDDREPSADGALVESTQDGWWYSARLPDGRGVAMFLTDADLRNQSTWDERLAAAPATLARLSQWRLSGETAMRAANSQRTAIVTGEGWVACGDAAAAFDPISSLGIGFALRSGMEAARVAAAAAEGDQEPAAAYEESLTRIYEDYRKRLRTIYRREGRWSQDVFWMRRQA